MPFVVRPRSILGTPRSINRALRRVDIRWKLRYYPSPVKPNRMFDYRRDFMMFPARPEHVLNAPAEYSSVFAFSQLNKYGQRRYLNEFVPTPQAATTPAAAAALAGDKFVVRPLRHSGGLGYRVTSDRSDFNPGAEYISELFPKRREYRVIFVFGQPILYLRKKQHEGVDETQPWGAANSSFQTILDVPGSRLAGTDCVPRLSNIPVVRAAHIVAADVLFNHKHDPVYSVLELNFCPGIDIENNLQKIVEVIRSRQ